MIKAYILVEIEAGQSDRILAELKSISAITAADAVTGPYDIIAAIEVPDSNTLGTLIRTRLQHLTGVKRTVTCLAF